MTLIQPVISGESDLSVTRTDLQRAVARVMGWDRDPNLWQPDETTDGNDWIKAAERRVYSAHVWSFLTPTVGVTLTQGLETYDLPDDFAAIEGPIYYAGNYANLAPIRQASLSLLWANGSAIVSTGQPKFFAVEALPHTGENIGQRYGLHFDVKPASPYDVKLRYRINPFATSSTRTYPLGGQSFAECLRFACMSQAEIEGRGGPAQYTDQFNMLLAEAISEDVRKGPTILGSNRIPKQYADGYPSVISEVTYNGVPVE